MFARKIYDQIVAWKAESAGKTALLVEGTPRVGKSTIMEEFAKNEYRSYLIVDFAFAAPATHALFDEVQHCPRARQAIKLLVKDGRYDYVETGSLISIRKNTKDILIPSEERKLQMLPMDFEEFRWALGDEATVPLLRSSLEGRVPFGDQLNRRLM